MQNKCEILTALRCGICVFTYTKMDGETRVATGTLRGDLIPLEYHPKGNGPLTENDQLVKYFDIDSKGWRSFHVENLKSLSLLESYGV